MRGINRKFQEFMWLVLSLHLRDAFWGRTSFTFCCAFVANRQLANTFRTGPFISENTALHARRKKNQSSMDDDMNRWYDEVDKDATPEDVFWEEMERQRLMNQIGDSSSSDLNKGPTAPASSAGPTTPVASVSTVSSVPNMESSSSSPLNKPPSPEELQSAEATLTEYEAFMVDDNWLNDDLIMAMEELKQLDEDKEDMDIEEETRRLEQQLEEMAAERGEEDDDDDTAWMQSDEPWDHWGEPKQEKDEPPKLNLSPEASEYLLDDDEDDEEAAEEARLEEERYLERLSELQIKSRRLENARNNPKAAAYFARSPDEKDGYDRMWVSAIDNVCFKNLAGVFRNYGIQFADNFGDWKDGELEDGFATIEEVASLKARRVYEVTGLPCIASRTSFEIEPVATPSVVGVNPGSPGQRPKTNDNPRVTSGYRFNDIGLHVDYMVEALKPLSEIDRVTRFRTCLCYYDGDMEVFDYGICDCDIYFANSLRTFIPMAAAINEMCKTLQLTFGLEYQKWLNAKVSDVASGSGGKAKIKLRDRVLKEGKVLPNDIIDVSAFMDAMVDVDLMDECARELANRFLETKPSKIVTVATTGLVIALPMAKYLQVPVVYARKERSVVMADTYKAAYSSKTIGKNNELLVSKSHLDPSDRCLVVDDFLSGGSSQEALLRIVSESGAHPVGVGVLLEKVYESGRQSLSGYDVPVHSLCRVASVKDGVIQLVEEEGFDRM